MGTREGERGYFSPGSKGWAEQFTVTRRDRAALVQMALTGSETWLGPACQQLSHCRSKASHQTHLLRGSLLPYPCPVTAADKTPDSAPQRGVWGPPHVSLSALSARIAAPGSSSERCVIPSFRKRAMQVCALKRAAQKSPRSPRGGAEASLEAVPFWLKSLFHIQRRG